MSAVVGPCVVGGLDIDERYLYACLLTARFMTAAWLPYFDDGEHKSVSLKCLATRIAEYMTLVRQ